LLEISTIGPFIGGLLAETRFEFHHGIKFIEELFDFSVKILLGEFAMLGPHKPFLAIVPLQKLHGIESSLLIIIVRNVIML
jgi:hypothetical protein